MKAFCTRGFFPLVLLALLGLALPAGATVVRFLSMEEHIGLSQLIVRVRAGNASTTTSEKDGRPRTDRRYTIVETYKGGYGPGKEIVVRQMRGDTAEGMLAIPGDPELREGEEAILFLATDGKGFAYLTALAQSKYNVTRDRSGAWVQRNFDGLAFAMGEDGLVVEPGDEAPVSLELFEKTLATIMQGK